MVHIGLRMIRLPKKRVAAQKPTTPRVVTISLVNPPACYRKAAPKANNRYIIYYF